MQSTDYNLKIAMKYNWKQVYKTECSNVMPLTFSLNTHAPHGSSGNVEQIICKSCNSNVRYEMRDICSLAEFSLVSL